MAELATEHRFIDGIEHKLCSTCKQWVPVKDTTTGVANFSKRAASKDGLSYSCKKCERVTATKSYKRRKQEKKRKQYYREHRERLLDQAASRYEGQKEMRQAQSADYRKSHPQVARKAAKTRRFRIKAQGSAPYTRDEVIAQATRDGATICEICGKPILSLADLELDHRIPIAQGGTDTADNLRPVHKLCNRKRPKDGRDLRRMAKAAGPT